MENDNRCSAQRHMGIEFLAYNSMLATAKAGQKIRYQEALDRGGTEAEAQRARGPLKYSGKDCRLANKINRSSTTACAMRHTLEHDGWIIPTQPKSQESKKQRRNKRAGTFTTYEYIVIEHDEFSRSHSCPPDRYEADGKPVKAARECAATPPHIRRLNAARFMGVSTSAPGPPPPDLARRIILGPPIVWEPGESDATKWMLEVVATARKITATENPVPVTVTRNLVTEPDTRNLVTAQPSDISSSQETLSPPSKETLSRTVTRNLVTTDTRNLVTRFSSLSALSLPANPTCPPAQSAAENGGQAGGDPFGDGDAPMVDITEQRWQRFRDAAGDNIPEELEQAMKPTPAGMRAVLAQVDECGGDMYAAKALAEEMSDWAETRKPKLKTLNAWLWGDGPDPIKQPYGWLKECTPDRITSAKESAQLDRKRWGANGLPYGRPNFAI
jgi:hypothetical protein